MSNQEMQFADPDWKPSQKLDAKTGTQEQETFIPEPINADSRERWNTTPPPPPRQEMYTGLPPYAGATPQQPIRGQYRGGSYRRGGRGIWFWVILAFIIISLMGGGFGSAFNRFGDGSRFGSQPFTGPQSTGPIVEGPRVFNVGIQPTVVINGDNGTITVQTSTDAKSDTVTVQDTKNASSFGDPNNLQVNYNQQGNTINASVPDDGQGSVDFTVTVPQGANLQLSTTGGEIDLTVPANSAFHLNASTSSGSINTPGFPGVTVNQAGTQATGNVGIASQGKGATVTLTTDSGDINVNQGP